MGRFLKLSDTAPVLAAAVRVDGAFGGYLSLYDPRDRTLKLHQALNLPPMLTAAASNIALHAHTACAQAARERRRVVIRDVATDAGYAPHVAFAEAAGFRAVQSTPLIASGRRLLGCMSTLFSSTHHPPPASLAVLDACARVAAQLIEAVQLYEALGTPRSLSRTAAHVAESGQRLVAGLAGPDGGDALLDAAEQQLTALLGELRAQSPQSLPSMQVIT